MVLAPSPIYLICLGRCVSSASCHLQRFFEVPNVADRFRQDGNEYHLVPGVRLDIAIVTGQRTVLEYLLAPFMAGRGQALQEH